MILGLADTMALAEQCAPTVAVETLLSIVQVESGFNPLAIGVNGAPSVTIVAANHDDAISKATALISAGRSIDLGLGQINSRNLKRLALPVDAAFDPCRNLAATAQILQEAYVRASVRRPDPQRALRTALSFYNTGHAERGLRNGYVAKVSATAGRLVPALGIGGPHQGGRGPAPATKPPPPWDVFARAERADGRVTFVFSPSQGAQR